MEKKSPDIEPNTEARIKAAAARLFMRNGFAATRTRDIALEAGINLALLNYYFRSKEKLFQIIMSENAQVFFTGVVQIFNNGSTSLDQKIEAITAYYISHLAERPDMASFILNEIRSNPEHLLSMAGNQFSLRQTSFFKQLDERLANTGLDPAHVIMNLLGMIIFPFIAAPIFQPVYGMTSEQFLELVKERVTLIPRWMQQILSHNQKTEN